MADITATEWEVVADRIDAGLVARWPWLRCGRLSVDGGVLKASVALRWETRTRSATIRTSIDSSACITGGLGDIAEAARQICEVRDAMLYIHGETAGLTVWWDGECPCSWCGTRGTIHGDVCTRCEGKGKR